MCTAGAGCCGVVLGASCAHLHAVIMLNQSHGQVQCRRRIVDSYESAELLIPKLFTSRCFQSVTPHMHHEAGSVGSTGTVTNAAACRSAAKRTNACTPFHGRSASWTLQNQCMCCSCVAVSQHNLTHRPGTEKTQVTHPAARHGLHHMPDRLPTQNLLPGCGSLAPCGRC